MLGTVSNVSLSVLGDIKIANKNYDELQHFVKNEFLFLNAKIQKTNRLNLAIRLHNHKMLKNAVWSLNTAYTAKDLYPRVSHLISKSDFDLFYSKIPHSPDNIKYDSQADHYLGYPFDHTMYEKTKYSIVSETHVSNNDPFMITEKTARAIINKHPFIIASPILPLYVTSFNFFNLGSTTESIKDCISDSDAWRCV